MASAPSPGPDGHGSSAARAGGAPSGVVPAVSAAPTALTAVGLLAAAVSAIDSDWPWGALLGPALALAAAARGRWRRPHTLPACVLAGAFAVSTVVPQEFRADSASYFVYLRSAVFDGDLDFADEWEHWGYPPQRITPTGLRVNSQSVGPALLWSPFYLAAHVYVKLGHALGSRRFADDGYDRPYRRATALGTLTAVVVGAALLVAALSRATGAGPACLAVAAAVFASPVLYYAWVVPAMSHGAAFGAGAAVVWAWERARRRPSLGAWTSLGALLGVAALMRWQAALLALLVAPLALRGLLRREVRWPWLAAAATAGAAAFAPQALAWRALYGSFLLVPQGGGFLDWTSPHFSDTLFSADHGFFSWTPAMLLGIVGLAAGLRRDPLGSGASLLVCFATAWVNGAVADWAASDAFGARRFDVVVPLAAAGLARLIADTAALAARAPLLVPASVLALLGAWNVGLVDGFRRGLYPQVAPLEKVARDQARRLRLAAQAGLGAIGGARGRALAYKFFSAEYAYTGNPAGIINLAEADERWLLRGWGTRGRRDAPSYRWALYPEACVRVPLEEPFEMAVTLTARAAPGVDGQAMTVLVNSVGVAAAELGREWQEVGFLVPARFLDPGENTLCLRFSQGAPRDEGGRAAAAVSRIQLP